MVKGISRQVIVVHTQESALFEQAIFILNDTAVGDNAVTETQLMQEATRLMGSCKKKSGGYILQAVWASVGALITSAIFLLFSFF